MSLVHLTSFTTHTLGCSNNVVENWRVPQTFKGSLKGSAEGKFER